MVVFAYDGSLGGDWVAHYAVRFAASSSERRLRLVHVHDGAPAPHVSERIARIDDECRVAGVELRVELDPGAREGVAARLVAHCPPDPGATIVCGTRTRPRRRAYLAGTVSERLLAAAPVRVVAMRVVHPGVLGQPGRVLLPLAGRPGSEADAIPVLALLGTALGHLHVLFVRELSRLRAVEPGRDAQARLLAAGRAFVARVEAEARAALAPHRFELDASVVLGRDVAREILVAAARHRTRLVCLGASKRTLPERLVHGNAIERVLRETTADVAVYRSARA